MIPRAQMFGCLLGLSLLAAAPARAADCQSLKLINSVDLKSGPGGLRLLVPVTINGTPKQMLLDTGGGITDLSRDVVKELNLHVDQINIKMLDLYGHASRDGARIDSLIIGRLQAKDTHLPVEPDPDFAKGTPWVGLLALDYLSRYDADLDVAGLKLNYFSRDHCDGQIFYWKAPAVAVVPMSLDNLHIVVPVTVDGRVLKATVDTGAPQTTMQARTAKYTYGVTEGSPGTVVVSKMKGTDLNVLGHVFNSLSFEGIAVNNPRIVILPDIVGTKDTDNETQVGSLIKKEDDDIGFTPMLIGMDVLRKLHIYMAFGEKKLYITAANPDDSLAITGAAPPQPPAGP